jgi:hypothetical protein
MFLSIDEGDTGRARVGWMRGGFSERKEGKIWKEAENQR